MQLLGTHKITYEAIRRLTIECYALASSAMELLHHSEYADHDGLTAQAYEELLSEKLLQLAIAIRTKFYQGADHRRTAGFLEDTGTYVKWSQPSGSDERQHTYTLKDICDKIIHAQRIAFILDPDMDVSFIELSGEQTVGKQSQHWWLTLLLPSVCEGILGWLDAVAEA